MAPHRTPIDERHDLDAFGNPAGGLSQCHGISVVWQNGPLRVECPDGDFVRKPNGAFVEDVIRVALGRIRHYQTASEGRFACRENALAITKLEEGLQWLDWRTASREERGLEGTHTP